jgi:hypothetical protein
MGRRFTVGHLAAVLEVPASSLLDPVCAGSEAVGQLPPES